MKDTIGAICFIISMSFAGAGIVAVADKLKYASGIIRYPIEAIAFIAFLFTLYWIFDFRSENHTK
jgi:hypothetical protein